MTARPGLGSGGWEYRGCCGGDSGGLGGSSSCRHMRRWSRAAAASSHCCPCLLHPAHDHIISHLANRLHSGMKPLFISASSSPYVISCHKFIRRHYSDDRCKKIVAAAKFCIDAAAWSQSALPLSAQTARTCLGIYV